MSGLRRICKAFGQMRVGGVLWLWDYVANEPVCECDMPEGSERRRASDRAQGLALKAAYERGRTSAQAAEAAQESD